MENKGKYYICGEMMELVDAQTTLENRIKTFPVAIKDVWRGIDGTLCIWVEDIEKLALRIGQRLIVTETEIGFEAYCAWWYTPKEVEDDSE